MSKKYLFLIVLVLLIINNFAQNSQFGIKENEYLKSKRTDELVSLLVKGEKENIVSAAKRYEANIKYNYQNIYAITIEKKYIDLFSQSISNSAIEIPVSKGRVMMDTALVVNNILGVHQALSPLSQSYKGSNVVVGILDSGIYFDHPDFKNADGSTRIRYIWDQNVNSSALSPAPYNYGAEWSWIDIDNGSCNHVEPSSQNGHGTTVAGAACGNGNGSGHFTGVAPESEIIAVAVDYYGNDFLTKIVDAIDYVFKKADALGKPCVINTSLGTYSGSHDGKDLTSQMIDALIVERSGRVVVASAGNGNNIGNTVSNYTPTHLSYIVNSDTSFTWFRTIVSQGRVYFELWADTAEFKNVSFAFQNDNPTNFTTYGQTSFLNIANDFNMNLSTGVFHTEFVFDDSMNNYGKVDYYLEETEGRYHLEFLITPDSSNHIWRFMTTGDGQFDVWSSAVFQGTSDMVYNNLPPSFVVPEIVNYKLPDNRKNIVSSWQCSDKVITVGNYSNRATYYDVDSILRQTNETPGEIFYQSSEGPTRDNRLKPDISATGNQTFATGNINFINLALAVNRPKVSYDTLHARNGGTSIASPVVAGAIALYFEANPDAYWYEVKEALAQSAKKDTFTGSFSNTQYGHGKLDAFRLLQFDAVLGCTDSSAFNYNAQANVDDGSCQAIVFGCTDSTALNYNANSNTDDGSCIEIVYGCTDSAAYNYDANANTNDGSCEYQTSINDIDEEGIYFFPNPVQKVSYLYYQYENDKAKVRVVNILGKQIIESEISSNQRLEISKNEIKSGIYFIEIQSLYKNRSKTIKFVVE